MPIHAAHPERSRRLQQTLACLRDQGRRGATTAELQYWTCDLAVHTTVAELRARGYQIPCVYEGRGAHGRRIYRYRLVRRAA